MAQSYQDIYSASMQDPQGFWADAAQGISWSKSWDKVLDDSNKPFYRWFSGAQLNTCYNAVDRHVEEGFGDQDAIIYDSPVTDTKERISFADLQQRVAKMAGALTELGVAKGDRVVIYMPMIPQTLVGMLACARIGAIHSVVFGGFAANELAARIDDAQPKVILSASCGIEPNRLVPYKPLLDDAIELSTHKPSNTIIYQREQLLAEMQDGRDIDWDSIATNAAPVGCVDVDATDPLYILYTSGTTGQPKGVVRDNGGHAVALKWSMENVYNVKPGDVFWAASDVGWVVGHSYICYGPLLNRCTTVLFEGKPIGTPDAGTFWRIIEEYQVKSFFTAPTAFRAIMGVDPQGDFLKDYDLSCLNALYLAGERCDPATLAWAEEQLQKPVIDHWWQTETGWPMAANLMGACPAPVKAGSPCRAVPGYQLEVIDVEGNPVEAGESGVIVAKLPLPPGTLPTLWRNNERFHDAYLGTYPGYYLTGDAGYIDEDDYLWIMSRIDDVINVAGHRLSTGRLEEALCNHEDVVEAAVIGVADDLKGELPLGMVVLKAGIEADTEVLQKELIKQVRDEVGPVAAFKLVAIVERLPKTRSGKVLRATMRKIANSEEYKIPATIEDASVLEGITDSLKAMGYGSA